MLVLHMASLCSLNAEPEVSPDYSQVCPHPQNKELVETAWASKAPGSASAAHEARRRVEVFCTHRALMG